MLTLNDIKKRVGTLSDREIEERLMVLEANSAIRGKTKEMYLYFLNSDSTSITSFAENYYQEAGYRNAEAFKSCLTGFESKLSKIYKYDKSQRIELRRAVLKGRIKI